MAAKRRIAIQLELEIAYKRHADIFAGTQRYALEQGWLTVIDEFVGDKLARVAPTQKGSCPYDGVIARVPPKLATEAARLGLPVVNVWLSSPACDRLPGVFPDGRMAGQLAAEHLLARGIRQFAAIALAGDRLSDFALEGFHRTLATAGFSCDTAFVRPDWASSTFARAERSEQIIEQLMSHWKRPIGVWIAAETLGRNVAQMCQAHGWNVPGDVAIVAGSNEERLCEHPRPSLTSVEMGYERIGYDAARMLDRLMDDPKHERGVFHVFLSPKGLVIRESTDWFAVDDPIVAKAMLFISEHLHKDIGVADVAKAVATEPKTLQRRFRKALDSAVAHEITRARIERAKRELAGSDRTVKQIAASCGFGEGKRLGEVFLRECGMTPTAYRKSITGE